MCLVFVYGTLKSYCSNNHLMYGFNFHEAEAPGIDIHAPELYGIPFAKKGEGTAIGEVYEIDNYTLKKLDSLEGHPNWYKRELISVLCGPEKIKKEAWIYLCPKDAVKFPRVEGGEW